MQDSLLYVILALIGVVIYLLIAQRKNKEEPKNNTLTHETEGKAFKKAISKEDKINRDKNKETKVIREIISQHETIKLFNYELILEKIYPNFSGKKKIRKATVPKKIKIIKNKINILKPDIKIIVIHTDVNNKACPRSG